MYYVSGTPIARSTGCVFITGIGQRLRSELQCGLYQGNQGEISPSVGGNSNTRSLEGQNMTALEAKSSVHQVHPASFKTSDGRAAILTAWGPGFEKEGATGVGGRGGRRNSICTWKL